MIRFFKKLFKRGDFMTRADKAYYKYRAKTIFWSAFCLIIISWVGTNLVLCALTTNVKSGGDIIYTIPHDVTLPKGQELNEAIKGVTNYKTVDTTIKTITFDYAGGGNATLVAGIDAETVNLDDQIYLYRLNGGADIYILSTNNLIANNDCDYLFYEFRSLANVVFNNFDATRGNITTMGYLFYNCSALPSLSCLSGWNTSSVTSMNYMCYNCSKINSLSGIANLDTAKVNSLFHTFEGCTALTTLKEISDWEVSQARMDNMFKNSGLTSIDEIVNWGTMLGDMTSMFEGTKISTVKLDGLTIEGTNFMSMTGGLHFFISVAMESMFANCKNLVSVTMTNFTFSFPGASNPYEINASKMFANCSNLTSVKLSNWTYATDHTVDDTDMFSGCGNLTSRDTSGLN